MAGISLGPSGNVGGYMETLRRQAHGNRNLGNFKSSPVSKMGMGGTNTQRPLPSPSPVSSGPVMPPSPSIGVAPIDPSANLPTNARSFGYNPPNIRAAGGNYQMDPMTPPSYTPPNPNPQGGIWDRFNSMARQRQF